jgi:hypothetical protein
VGLVPEASSLVAPSTTTWDYFFRRTIGGALQGNMMVAPNICRLLTPSENSQGGMFIEVLSGDPPISSGFTTSEETLLELDNAYNRQHNIIYSF